MSLERGMEEVFIEGVRGGLQSQSQKNHKAGGRRVRMKEEGKNS